MSGGRKFVRYEINRLGIIHYLFLYPELYYVLHILNYMSSVSISWIICYLFLLSWIIYYLFLYPELYVTCFYILNSISSVFIPWIICYLCPLFYILNYMLSLLSWIIYYLFLYPELYILFLYSDLYIICFLYPELYAICCISWIMSSSSSALQPWVGFGLLLRFRNNIFFYRLRLLASCPTPNLEGQGIPFRLHHHPWPVWHGRPYQ